MLSFIVFTLTACKKDDPERVEKRHFSCKINGVEWEADNGYGYNSYTNFEFEYYPPESSLEDWANSMILFAEDPDNAVDGSFRTNVSLKGIFLGEGRYEIQEDTSSWARAQYYYPSIPGDTSYDICLNGYIEFTRFEGPWDSLPWNVRAEFEYTLLGEYGDTLRITDGLYYDYD